MLGEAARLMRAALDGKRAASASSTGAPADRARAAARRSGRAARATTTAPRTGAPAAKEERSGRARRGHPWPCAPRTSTAPCACSVSRASRCSRTTSQAATSSRSRSRSTPRAGRARSTSTGRSPAVYVEARAERLSALADARLAIEDLGREPAAAIYAAAHSGKAGDQPLLRTIVLPLLADVAEACGGFDWSDEAFDRAYVELERSLLGERRTYAAVAPLARALGRSAGGARRRAEDSGRRRGRAGRALARGERTAAGRVRHRAGPALRARARALPAAQRAARARRAGRARRRGQRAAPCDRGARRRGAGAVRAARLAAAGDPPDAADRGDRAARASRRGSTPSAPGSRPICSRASGGPKRIRSSRRRSTAGSCRSFADEPFRSEQLREALAALLGGPDGLWAASVRAAVLLGETGRDRADELERLRGLARGETAGQGPRMRFARRSSRRSPTATAQASWPRSTTRCVGVRPRPAGYFAALAS